MTKESAAEWIAVVAAIAAAASSIRSCQQAAASVEIAEKAGRIAVWQETQRRWSELRSIAVGDCQLASEFLDGDLKDCSSSDPLTPLQRDNWKTQFLYLMEEILVVTEDMPDSIRVPWTEFVRTSLRTPAACVYARTWVPPEGNRWFASFRDEVNRSPCAQAETKAAAIKVRTESSANAAATTKFATPASPPLLRAR